MKKCPRCGAENPDDRKWCIRCLKPLQGNPAADSDNAFPTATSGKGSDTADSKLIGNMGGKNFNRGKREGGIPSDGDSKKHFCPKCGSPLLDGDLLCPRCRRELGKDSDKRAGDGRPPKKRKWKGLIIAATLLVFICVGAYYALALTDTVFWDGTSAAVPGKQIYDNGDCTYTPSEKNIVIQKESGTIYYNNQLIAYTFDDLVLSETTELASMVNGTVVGKVSGMVNLIQIQVRESSLDSLMSMADTLMKDERVLYASPDYPVEISETNQDSNPWSDSPSDPAQNRGNEAHPGGNDWWAEAIGAYSAWKYESCCTPIKVGVLDSGFWDQHDDLKGRISFLPEFPTNSSENHGTHVAGLIAANNNTIGIRGIADKASLICTDWSPEKKVNYLGSSGVYVTILKQFIENDAQVINNSWGIHFASKQRYTHGLPEFVVNWFKDPYDTYVKQIEAYSRETAKTCMMIMIEMLLNHHQDFLIIQAAGNGYDNAGPGIETNYACFFCGIDEELFNSILSKETREKLRLKEEISYSKIDERKMIVGAVENITDGQGNYQMSYFSNYGENVDICAPGGEIYSTINKQTGLFAKKSNYTYGNNSGTSMAAPIVAGSAAQVWSIYPSLSAGEVKERLIRNCTAQAWDPETNSRYPMVNVGAAVESLDKSENETDSLPENADSTERDIVLVLDTSGSMSGTPMEETKKASANFINTILEKNASIGIVTYDNSANRASDFSVNKTSLENIVSGICDGGGTNIEAGLREAHSMLSSSDAKKKIIVLMSDGEPNEGKEADELVAYADEIKASGVRIYTLGFFSNLGSDKASAQALMEQIASDGCHYEVASVDDLVFFFEDMADQINGQKYIYVRIACPVDVFVSYNGETLSSSPRSQNLRTDFGTLTFEESDDGASDPVKILRLKEPAGYDVKIFGTGHGYMDYTIGFMDENGEYTDLRMFTSIPITNQTVIDTVAAASNETVIKVDEDGDGRYDIKYRAKEFGYGRKVNNNTFLYWSVAVGAVSLLLIGLVIRFRKGKRL